MGHPMIPHIPRFDPRAATAGECGHCVGGIQHSDTEHVEAVAAYRRHAPPPDEGFTVPDGAAWLGIPWEVIEAGLAIRSGGPFIGALLDARKAQGTDTTPEQVLARHDIDPADPLAAQRAWDQRMRTFED